MWSLLLAITIMGVTKEYVLPGYYDTHVECEETISRLMEKSEVREEVEEATIECVEGWHVDFR